MTEQPTQPPITPITPPSPAGVRLPYAQAPERIRRWVERELGSGVRAAYDQTGGFSPGPAARLVTGSGRRAFVKAIGPELNPLSPLILRQEIESLRRFPDAPWRPRLLAAYDDGRWVGLLLEDVEGRQPEVWTEPDVRLVFDALVDLGDALTPVDWPDATRLVARENLQGWRELAAAPPSDLPGWVTEQRLGQLIELEDAARKVLDGEHLTHSDIRRDNLLIRPEGTVVFLDWAWTCRAAGWADVLFTALDLPFSGSGVDADALLARHPSTRKVDPYAITAAIGGLAGAMAVLCRQPAPSGLPTIRQYQRPVADLLLDWTRRRMGWQ